MPKRSNQFQRLIVAIHHALAADHAFVEESRELHDRVTGTTREVDIVIEAAVGDYPVFVCVECCDRSRPATVEWVEQQHATSVLLMLFPTLEPRPRDPSHPALSFDDILLSPDGTWRIPVTQFVDTLLNHPAIHARTAGAVASQQDAGWIVGFPVSRGSRVQSAGEIRSLEGLGLVVLTKRRSVPFNLTQLRVGPYEVAYGDAHSDLGELLLTVLESKDQPPKAVLLRRLGEFTNAATIPGRPVSPSFKAPDEAMAALMGGVKTRLD